MYGVIDFKSSSTILALSKKKILRRTKINFQSFSEIEKEKKNNISFCPRSAVILIP